MRPGARVGAAIELLDNLEHRPTPADRVVSGYFRDRRYIGSKDRREIGNLVFTSLRARQRLRWWLARAGRSSVSARDQLLAVLLLVRGQTPDEVAALFAGEGYSPAALTPEEARLCDALAGQGLDHPEQPAWVRDEVEPWLHERLHARFGDDLAVEMAALTREADVILRVNTLKTEVAVARVQLAEEGIATCQTGMSPWGLKMEGRRALQTSRAFREGLVEVQDEASQLAALLCNAAPGMAVADYCAGAGGKTLALAATMQGTGRLVALDNDAARLRRAHPRLMRAGAEQVEIQFLPDSSWIGRNAGVFERVFVDAPCSGSGIWRRQPDARAALTPERLEGYLKAQAEVLEAASGLVSPGGRLIYATCSLLAEEDEAQVEAFLCRRPEFRLLPVTQVWAEVLPSVPCPAGGPLLLLTPHRHRTDGFFLAVLERREVA